VKWQSTPLAPQFSHQIAVAPDVILEDQRKSDQNGSGSQDGLNHPFWRRFNVQHLNIDIGAAQHSREVAQPEVCHFLETDEDHIGSLMRQAQFRSEATMRVHRKSSGR
jgi:hypothetical protein